MIELSPTRRRELRAQAHHLHPIVSISQNGLSEAVLKEIDRSLRAHELIKVRLYGIERGMRTAVLEEICAALDCAPVQQIGNILILWREQPAEAAETTPNRPKRKPLTKKQAAAATENPRRRLGARR